MKELKYFDYCATTPVSDDVLACMNEARQKYFYNPSALYNAAAKVNQKKEAARKTIGNFLGADAGEIIFTSGGTESNNLAIFGSVKNKKGKIISTKAEHASVYYPLNEMKNRGYEVCYAPVDKNGIVKADELIDMIDDNTVMVSVMHVNNETGGINDIRQLCDAVKSKNKKCLFMCDGVQAFGKIPVNVKNLGVDFYTISAHKIYGPKGCGALYVKKGININPLIYGGGQENKLRSGTENVPAILGFEKAVKMLDIERQNSQYIEFKNILKNTILSIVSDFMLFDQDKTSPDIFTVIFKDIKAEVILHMLEDAGFIVGNGSACSSKSAVSRVAEAIGLTRDYAEGMIRISFGTETSQSNVTALAHALCDAVIMLRRLTGRK